MDAGASAGSMLGTILSFISDLVLRWIPGTAVSVVSPESTASITQSPALTQPLTPGDVVAFLQGMSTPETYEKLTHGWAILIAIAVLVSLILITLIIYCFIRIRQIRAKEYQHFAHAAHSIHTNDVPKTQLRWRRILEEVRSEDEKSWRLAILEGDIMLNELLDSLGYKGETMADKMKLVDRADFQTIDIAWEAHRIRNKVAHEGLEVPLDSREVIRVIGMYEKIFREFKFIE